MEKRGMSQELPEDDEKQEERFEKDAMDSLITRVIDKQKTSKDDNANTSGTIKFN